jgi:serine/threonine protein kinase
MTINTRILGNPRSGSTSANNQACADTPERIDGYRVVKAIGQGGMGQVFEVQHSNLEKSFALKLLAAELQTNAEAVKRFRSETLALGKLEHPNIVLAIDAGVWEGRPYLVTELLKGAELGELVAQHGKLDVESTISIAKQLAQALGFAHLQGYFHRDIKPSNIFMLTNGMAKLLDFGLVRSQSSQLTQAGCFMGTADFVAPEQAGNANLAGKASDIYSLGCTLIYMLSGDVPFPNVAYPSLLAKLQGHLQDQPAWLQDPAKDAPGWLVSLIAAMVAKNSSQRPTSCELVHSCLENRCYPAELESHQSICNPRTRRHSGKSIVIGCGLATALSAGSLQLWEATSARQNFATTAQDQPGAAIDAPEQASRSGDASVKKTGSAKGATKTSNAQSQALFSSPKPVEAKPAWSAVGQENSQLINTRPKAETND